MRDSNSTLLSPVGSATLVYPRPLDTGIGYSPTCCGQMLGCDRISNRNRLDLSSSARFPRSGNRSPLRKPHKSTSNATCLTRPAGMMTRSRYSRQRLGWICQAADCCPRNQRTRLSRATRVREAARGCAAYQLNWFDAHMWAYAEHYGLAEILTEDFQHDRLYGSVRAVNPFGGPQ